ncbi:hypothetical protein ACGGAQ_26010 [Micromonospora sp. NPDC047557]|uniref:hypothetical protein n=1 Tax=Micromonospora sp. NPDC047557 TaxID=3364250 RepID=UPI0037160479
MTTATTPGVESRPSRSSMPGGRHLDTTVVTGRAGSRLANVAESVALLLAAGADVAAFYSALADGLNAPTYLLFLLVAGFTAVALLLAHGSGRIFRDLDQGAPGARRLALSVCLVGWALLGVAAFLARLLLAEEASGGSFGTPTSAQTDSGAVLVMAILFLALYLATGAAAALVAYWNHNSLSHAYARSIRTLARARKVAAKQLEAHEKALSPHRQRYNEWFRTEAAHAAANAKRLALAEELKQLARQRMAAAAQDPATTEGLFDGQRYPDPSPSPYRGPRSYRPRSGRDEGAPEGENVPGGGAPEGRGLSVGDPTRRNDVTARGTRTPTIPVDRNSYEHRS